MKSFKFVRILLAGTFAFIMLAGTLFAEMNSSQRLAIIKALKKQGIVGENNKGYLEFKGAIQAKEVVDEENCVRKKAYEAVAASTKVSVEQVGINRAAQIAAESSEDTLIQLPDGRWIKK
jgi:uncharacterized protein YdbL (DUF1318 family)